MNFTGNIVKFSTNANSTPKELYKYLIRQCKRLPSGPRQHYHFMIKQSYKQHVNEQDAERIKQIIRRAYEDTEWILKKYLGTKDS